MDKLSKTGWILNEKELIVYNRKGDLISTVYPLFNVSKHLLPTQHKDIKEAIKVGKLIADAPLLLYKLELLLMMYAKGIKPSVGMIKEIESLIEKHS